MTVFYSCSHITFYSLDKAAAAGVIVDSRGRYLTNVDEARWGSLDLSPGSASSGVWSNPQQRLPGSYLGFCRNVKGRCDYT